MTFIFVSELPGLAAVSVLTSATVDIDASTDHLKCRPTPAKNAGIYAITCNGIWANQKTESVECVSMCKQMEQLSSSLFG